MNENMIIKGKRPNFYDTPGVDYLMHMVMALAQELSANRDRLDTLEKVIEEKNILTEGELERYVPSQDTLECRETRRQRLLSTMFSVVMQESAELENNDTKARFDKIIDDIARRA